MKMKARRVCEDANKICGTRTWAASIALLQSRAAKLDYPESFYSDGNSKKEVQEMH